MCPRFAKLASEAPPPAARRAAAAPAPATVSNTGRQQRMVYSAANTRAGRQAVMDSRRSEPLGVSMRERRNAAVATVVRSAGGAGGRGRGGRGAAPMAGIARASVRAAQAPRGRGAARGGAPRGGRGGRGGRGAGRGGRGGAASMDLDSELTTYMMSDPTTAQSLLDQQLQAYHAASAADASGAGAAAPVGMDESAAPATA
jgi:hypothetical protein